MNLSQVQEKFRDIWVEYKRVGEFKFYIKF